MVVDDGNDSLATISDAHYVEPNQASRLVLAESRIQKPKGEAHAPWRHLLPPSSDQKLEDEVDEEPVILSDKKINSGPLAQFIDGHQGPIIKDIALNQLQRKPGHVPISSLFHLPSYRTRYDDTDDEDLDRIASIKRRKADANAQRGKSVVYDSIFWDKGEFSFPYRTFRPKVQVPSEVSPGATPQAIIADRLHRIYRRLDLETILRKLGVEYADLLPPPNYGEQNVRFLQESMWKNRSRISGVEKRTYIYGQVDDTPDDTVNDENSESSKSGSSYYGSDESDKSIEFTAAEEASKNAYLQSKSQFGHTFPLEYFDNEDFDIRSPRDWMGLRFDGRGREKYPLPGKAYLPMPLDTPTDLTLSLSQITSEILLDKTLRLQSFRKWLIKQRYRRIVHDARDRNKLNVDDFRDDTGTGITPMINIGTTVKSLFHSSPEASMSTSKTGDKSRDVDSERGQRSSTSVRAYSWEYSGESELDSLSLLSLEQLSDDFLSQFSKGNAHISTEEALELVKRSQSILSDLWSDPNSLEYLLEAVKVDEEDELLGEDAPVDYVKRKKELELAKFNESMRIIASKAAQEFEQRTEAEIGLGSPDTDAFSQGTLDFVYDYNKMKKVHNYNWKWMDVAVFEFHTIEERYLVRTISNPIVFAWVPKIYLCFDAEDPRVHGDRVKDAIDRRNQFETILRYNLYVDCLPVENSPGIAPTSMTQIESKVRSTPKFVSSSQGFEMAQKEVNLDYMRAHNNMFFDYITDSHSKAYKTWVNTEDYYRLTFEPGADWRPFQTRITECSTNIFLFKKYRLEQSSVIYTAEPFAAFSEIYISATEVRSRQLMLARLEKPLGLNSYIQRQQDQIQQTKDYLRNDWLNFVLDTIKVHLKKVSHSWYNMDENEWNVFEVSKISRYLKLIKFLMQDILQHIVVDSVAAYLNEIRSLTKACADVEDDYDWNNDLKTTEFPPPIGYVPIWILELSFSRLGPTYDYYLHDFPKSLTELIITGIDATAGIPDILPLIMTNLLFGVKKTLSSVTKEEMRSSIEELKRLLRKALLPVDAYAQKYKEYMPIWHLDLDQYMNEWNSIDRNVKEIKTTVDFHIQQYTEIETEIPTMIDIGPFRINIDYLKTELLRRKKLVYTSILENFAAKLQKTVHKVLSDYEEIVVKMSIRSDQIEEVMEQKHFLAGVPQMIAKNEEIVQNVMRDYEVFERFKFKIPLEDFEAKWTAMMGLRKMYKLADEAVNWLGSDYRRLLRVQKTDLTELSEAVDKVTASVVKLAQFTDVSKVIEAKREVQIVGKLVKELQERSDRFNQRQLLFGLPQVQKEMLGRLVEDLHKYKSFWLIIGEWLKTQDEAVRIPMNKLDMTAIDQFISDGLKIMRKSIKYFGQTGEIGVRRLARKVKRQIDAFRKLLPLVYTFTNPGLKQRHLDAISEICGFPVLFNSTSSLKELTDFGLEGHVDEIEKVRQDSEHELQIELALKQMELDASEIRAILVKDPTTEIDLLTLPDDTEQFLDSSLQKIADIRESLYKAPFVNDLDSWEQKLLTTSDTLKQVQDAGPGWVQIQTLFEAEDVETKIPAEFQLFLKMKRIWRRIMRIIRATPQILAFGSETTLMASISQFKELDGTVRGLLDESLKVKSSDSVKN